MIHSSYRVLNGLEHITLKFGIFNVALRVGHYQAKLARQVLDVMNDEGEAFAVLVQQFIVAQHSRRCLFGEIASRLTPGRSEQVKRLPIERDGPARAVEEHEPNDFAAMRQRHRQPRL